MTSENLKVFFKRVKSLVWLDIGSSAVKAVELKTTGTGYKVSALGSELVPPPPTDGRSSRTLGTWVMELPGPE